MLRQVRQSLTLSKPGPGLLVATEVGQQFCVLDEIPTSLRRHIRIGRQRQLAPTEPLYGAPAPYPGHRHCGAEPGGSSRIDYEQFAQCSPHVIYHRRCLGSQWWTLALHEVDPLHQPNHSIRMAEAGNLQLAGVLELLEGERFQDLK